MSNGEKHLKFPFWLFDYLPYLIYFWTNLHEILARWLKSNCMTTSFFTFLHYEEALTSLRPPGGRGEGRGVKNYGRAWSKLKQILAISRSWTTAPPCNTAIILPYPHTPYHFDVYPYVTFWHNPSPQNINLYHLKKKPDFFLVYENDIPGVIPQDSWYIVIIFWNTPMLHVLLYSFG